MYHCSVSARYHRWLLAAGCLFITASASLSNAATLSDNLSAPTSYTELVYSSNWITASFKTGPSASTLTSATLLLQRNMGNAMNLSLYSDRNGQPTSLIGALTAPSSYGSDRYIPTVFDGSGLSLSANTIYWLVANSSDGQFEWAYTDDNTGLGIGFQHTWGTSTDAGRSWYTSTLQPMQMRVDDTSVSLVPEPAVITLLLLGSTIVALAALSRRSAHV